MKGGIIMNALQQPLKNDGKPIKLLIEKQNSSVVLSEEDFYPPQDSRKYRSGVNDIYGGDNFADFAKDFYEYCQDFNGD